MKQVALRAGKSSQWLSDRLHGRSPIYADDVLLLAKGLKIDPCDFFREDMEPVPIPSREDRESRSEPDDLDAERLYRRWRAIFDDEPETAAEVLDFLEYRRRRRKDGDA